jgi:hypothetical protein
VSEKTSTSSMSPEESRRRFLQRAGGIAFATPVMMTMLSSSARASHTTCGAVIVSLGNLVCDETAPCHTLQVCLPSAPQEGAPCTCAPAGGGGTP